MVIREVYRDFLVNERGFSPNTSRAYLIDLNQFFASLDFKVDQATLYLIELDHLRGWIIQLKQSHITPKSINRKISSLKTFFNFCKRQSLINSNPLSHIKYLKEKKRLPIVVSELDLRILFSENKKHFHDNFIGSRDKLIIDLFYQTGIRLSELINIKMSDFNCETKSLRVLGKRNKQRDIPLTNNIVDTYNNYIKHKSNHLKIIDHDFLFITSIGGKAYSKMIYRIVNNYLGRVSTIQKKSPHVLRHAFATHLLDKGADINAIKELLGHSSLAATQIYTHISGDKIKKAYTKAHPRG